MLIAGITATAGLGAVYFSPWVWRRYRMHSLRNTVRSKRILALTYDDGPSSAVTPQLLDLLGRDGSQATFFMLGQHAQRYPEIVDRVAAEGHEIGCHSDRHVNAWKASPWNALADIRAGYEHLSRWVEPDGMFRPPHGKMTFPTYCMLRGRGVSIWWWTLDSGDTHDILPDPLQVVDAVRHDGGGIILMHDLDRGSQRNQFVLEVTAALLDVAKADSLKVSSLRALCQ